MSDDDIVLAEWWTEERLVTHLGITHAKLRRFLHSCGLPHILVGKNRYYDPDAVHAWLMVRSMPRQPRKRRPS